MKSFKVKPRYLNTPCSLYWQKTESSGVKAEADPTAIPSSPAETCQWMSEVPSKYYFELVVIVPYRNLVGPVFVLQTWCHPWRSLLPLSDPVWPEEAIHWILDTELTSEHVLIPSNNLIVIHVKRPRFIHNDTVRVHNSVCIYCCLIRGPSEAHLACEFAIDCSRKSNTMNCQRFQYPRPDREIYLLVRARGLRYWYRATP